MSTPGFSPTHAPVALPVCFGKATLSRKPTKDESAAMLKLAAANKGAAGLEDVWWVILNSAEFNTNH